METGRGRGVIFVHEKVFWKKVHISEHAAD
jgi:hypothetical protein